MQENKLSIYNPLYSFRLLDFPNEILLLLLYFVKAAGPGNLINFMRCSSHFRQMGLEIIGIDPLYCSKKLIKRRLDLLSEIKKIGLASFDLKGILNKINIDFKQFKFPEERKKMYIREISSISQNIIKEDKREVDHFFEKMEYILSEFSQQSLIELHYLLMIRKDGTKKSNKVIFNIFMNNGKGEKDMSYLSLDFKHLFHLFVPILLHSQARKTAINIIRCNCSIAYSLLFDFRKEKQSFSGNCDRAYRFGKKMEEADIWLIKLKHLISQRELSRFSTLFVEDSIDITNLVGSCFGEYLINNIREISSTKLQKLKKEMLYLGETELFFEQKSIYELISKEIRRRAKNITEVKQIILEGKRRIRDKQINSIKSYLNASQSSDAHYYRYYRYCIDEGFIIISEKQFNSELK